MNAVLTPQESVDGFPAPRPFQIKAHDALRDGFRQGHKNQLIMAPTGAGKTYLGLRIAHEAIQKGKRAVFLCDRTTLIDQTSSVADRYGLTDHGVIQANHWRRRGYELLQIASVQTIAKRAYWPETDVLIVDECFPGETLISTPHGLVEIRTLTTGSLIYNSMGVGRVDSVFSKPATTFCTVRLSNGTTFRCTPDHPVFTEMGWKPAGSLEVGSRVFRLQDLPRLHDEIHAKNGEGVQGKGNAGTGIRFQEAEMLWEILCQETEESHASGVLSSKDAGHYAEDCTQASDSRRQWAWNDIYSSNGTGESWEWMGRGIYICDEEIKQGRISASLQTGLGERAIDDCDRAGWAKSLQHEEARSGQEEGCFASLPWVESIEIGEQGSSELVYNLRVSGHPSYFANGTLVHNCHTTYKAWTDYAKSTKAAVIGLSATPFTTGLGLIFSNLINATTMFDLTQSGVLVPMRVFSCHRPDMTGAATAGGEWTDKAAEERGLQIIGDVVADWIKYGENRKTIVFGSTIKHCEELCGQFTNSGIMAAVFTSNTTASEREELLNEYRKPNSHLKVLISVEALAKGFDVPDVGCICDARPLRKSLSTAIQMWGRGLRSSPETGKQDCYLLDFSGNIVRFFEDFNDIYFNGLKSLDDGDKLDKTIRKKEEFEAKGCPRCGFTPFHKRCMACGHEKVSRDISEALPGHMQEIFIGTGAQKKKLASSAENLWHQVCTYARFHSKPDKQAGRAWHLFEKITGQKTKWKFDAAPNVEITKNTYNKIQAMNIAYKKGRG